MLGQGPALDYNRMHSYYESILETEVGENSTLRYRNLREGIGKIQCSKPIGCVERKNNILVVLGNAVFVTSKWKKSFIE